MTHAELLGLCLLKKGAYIDHPFGEGCDVVKVRGRIFAQLFELRGVPKVTLNCEPLTGDFYRRIFPDAVTRGYHCPPVQQPYFNTISLDGSVPDDELCRMLDHSYEYVVSKLAKRVQRELSAE